MAGIKELEYYSDKLFSRIDGWETRTLQRIGARIKATGKLSQADRQALRNMANLSRPMEQIYTDLAQVTARNVGDIRLMFTAIMRDVLDGAKPLYKARNMPIVPIEKNPWVQRLIDNWVRQTSGAMINLTRTKALGFAKYNTYGMEVGYQGIGGAFQDAIDSAAVAVTSGTTDFNAAMRDVIKDLGGSGVRAVYASGVTRSLESMVRQNLIYASKQAAQDYTDHIGEEIGADGFEVDYHGNPRPSHEFMQGKMFSLHGDKTINGVFYPDGAEALARMQDYGCRHFRMPVILGVSEPAYNAQELARLKQKDGTPIEYNGQKKLPYEWTQEQRAIERAIRKQKNTYILAKSSGDDVLAKQSREKIKALRQKYDDLCAGTGLQPTLERATVSGYR